MADDQKHVDSLIDEAGGKALVGLLATKVESLAKEVENLNRMHNRGPATDAIRHPLVIPKTGGVGDYDFSSESYVSVVTASLHNLKMEIRKRVSDNHDRDMIEAVVNGIIGQVQHMDW